MNRLTENKGITLVALVITIIILLILAVVSIKLVVNDGIISHAQNATNQYTEAEEKEKIGLGYVAYKMAKVEDESATLTVADAETEENKTEGWTITFDKTKNIYTLTATGIITKEEFFKKAAIDIITDKNSTIDGKAPSADNPVIPAGFMPINAGEAKWDAEGGPEVDKGLVISDGTSEFVWIPVTKTIKAYKVGTTEYREPDVVIGKGNEYDADPNPTNLTRAGCADVDKDGDKDKDDFKQQLTNEFNAMANSVKKYHGFYVGRYEMSLDLNGKVQSKRGETSTTAAIDSTSTWYGLYDKAKTYTNPNEENSVASSMIWGSQYDAMMNWMKKNGINVDITNPIIDSSTGETASKNTDRTTGTCDTDILSNVYDLLGNNFELTLEANSTGSRVSRGGGYRYSNTPSSRHNYNPSYTNGVNGSRLTLYVSDTEK